ncbi:MAG TPA: cytochrome c biogenesis protein CcdA [Nitrospiraceae bacterium]|jgi:cytochrome c-type biogenesis protein|nr:cytochrome c biogenesis protein CcdA [Nitrospiraceae bacterium]
MIDSLPHTSLLAAFLAGLLSFVSPCVLPLVPSYLMSITGLSLHELTDSEGRHRQRATIIANSLLFIAGFSAVFVAFGASASLIGRVFADHQALIRKVGAALIVAFGLSLLGIVKLRFLMRERRVWLAGRPIGAVGPLLIGATFAAGWTPCVGPVLGTILLYAAAADTVTDGVALLGFYSLGLGSPLFAAAIGLDRFLDAFKQIRAYLGVISAVSGLFLIVLGVMLYRDDFALLSALFERYGIGVVLGTDD